MSERAQVTLKSGAQIEFDIGDLEVGRNGVTSEIQRLNWDTPEGWSRKLLSIELEDIAAIVIVRGEPS